MARSGKLMASRSRALDSWSSSSKDPERRRMAGGRCSDECRKLSYVLCKEAVKKRRMDKKEVATDESNIIIMAALMQNKE